MDLYQVTDGLHHHEFSRSSRLAAVMQAHGVLVMDARLDPDIAELHLWRGDSWLSLGLVHALPQQAPYSEPENLTSARLGGS